MIIGVHSKSAFKRERSRVDEYVYQLIKHFAMLDEATRHRFLLYTPFYHDTLYLPPNFIVRRFYTPFFWTKLFFSLKVWFDAPNVLFMPVNFLPLFSFRRTIAVIHGLEFEVYPEMFEAAHLNYLRKGTKRVARYATKIIVPTNTVMENLIKFYHVDQSRIVVIPYGVNPQIAYHHRYAPIDEQYILFVGKLEKRKNIIRLLKAFEILKEKDKIPHKLVLVGAPGFGFGDIQKEIEASMYKNDIVMTGYISHEEKESFFKYAHVVVFPSFYEGFGMQILEAQLRQVPLVTSDVANIREVAGDGALFADPQSSDELTEALRTAITDDEVRHDLVQKGLKNVQKYSWFRCAKMTLETLIS